jgi:hypothetical protein
MMADSAHALLPVRLMYRGQRQSSKRGSCGRRPNVSAATPRAAPLTQVHALHAQGSPVAVIARTLGISRPTAHTYLLRDTPARPETAPVPVVGSGAKPLHSQPDPPLTEEQGGQRPALARDSSIGLSPLRLDRLPIHHPAASRRRGRTLPGPQGSPYTRPQGHMTLASLGPQSLVDRVLLRSACHCSRVFTGGWPIPQPVEQTLRGRERRQMHAMSLATRLSNS